MRSDFLGRLIRNSEGQDVIEVAFVLPICLYAFFLLMEISLSLYSANLVRNTAENTLHFVQSRGSTAAMMAVGSGVDSGDVASLANGFARAYFAQSSMNLISADYPDACVSWWQPSTVVGPFHSNQCANGGGVGAYGQGNGDSGSPQPGQLVAVQVTWQYNPWIGHLFPTPSTFTYTAVGPVTY